MGPASNIVASPNVSEQSLIHFEYDLSDSGLDKVVVGQCDVCNFVDDRIGQHNGGRFWSVCVIGGAYVVGARGRDELGVESDIVCLVTPGVLQDCQS